ncbi:MAG: TerD family protein [Rhodospirillales bacterium]|nr:TerD family protein [Alphaproteobacteria bacterium]MCB9986518.1 TerD family protein [Rhodospirillales bacterium]USO06945.1 MAG: TerD family protein [Rhodospirillales bacterium]
MTDRKDNLDDINLSAMDAGLKKLIFGCGWEFPAIDTEKPDVDLCCFLLGRDGITREDEDFIFYNNMQGAELAVKHLGDNRPDIEGPVDGGGDNEAVMVDLTNLSFDVWRIVFVAAIYQGNDRDQSFSQIKALTARVENADSGAELHRIVIPGTRVPDATAVKIAELYREGVQWHIHPLCEPALGGLAEIARAYGLQISSTT